MEYSSSAFWNPWETEIPAMSVFPADGRLPLDSLSARVAVTGSQFGLTFPGLPQTEREIGWGHRANYSSQVKGSFRPGLLGAGWFPSDFPFAVMRKRGKKEVIAVVSGAASVHWFDWQRDEYCYRPLQQTMARLVTDTVDRSLKFIPGVGPELHFHSFEESLPRPLRGRLKRLSSPDRVFKIVRTLDDAVAEIQWLDENGKFNALHYGYESDQHTPHSPILTDAVRTHEGKPQERVQYEFKKSQQATPLLIHLQASVYKENGWGQSRSLSLKYQSLHRSGGKSPLLHKLVSRISGDGAIQEDLYEVKYDAFGHVIYVVHEGEGPPPVFF